MSFDIELERMRLSTVIAKRFPAGFGRGRADTSQSGFDGGEMSGINAVAGPFAITVGEF